MRTGSVLKKPSLANWECASVLWLSPTYRLAGTGCGLRCFLPRDWPYGEPREVLRPATGPAATGALGPAQAGAVRTTADN